MRVLYSMHASAHFLELHYVWVYYTFKHGFFAPKSVELNKSYAGMATKHFRLLAIVIFARRVWVLQLSSCSKTIMDACIRGREMTYCFFRTKTQLLIRFVDDDWMWAVAMLQYIEQWTVSILNIEQWTVDSQNTTLRKCSNVNRRKEIFCCVFYLRYFSAIEMDFRHKILHDRAWFITT